MSIYKKKSYFKLKAFVALTLVTLVGGKIYLWAHNTTLTEQKDLALSKMSQAIDKKITEVNEAAKEKTRNVFDSMLSRVNNNPSMTIPKDTQNKQKISEENKFNEEEQNSSNSSNSFEAVAIKYQVDFKYDHYGAPKNIDEKQFLSLLDEVSDFWAKSCGVKFNFTGMINSDYVRIESEQRIKSDNRDFGIVRWADLPQRVLGQASLGENGPVKNFLLEVDNNSFGGLDKQLKFTLIHELGHVLGLTHNRHDHSIMHETLSQQSLQQITQRDKEICQEEVASWDKYPKNNSMRIAIK